MIQIIDKEMCKLYLFTVRMKGMPFKNFKIVKLKKTRAIKSKIQERHMTLIG